MSYTSLLIRNATISRETANGFDDYGNIIKDWVTVASDVPCRIVMQSSSESLDDRNTVVKNGLLFLLPNADITFLDRVEIDNETWEVFGEPNYINGLAGVHHVEAPVRLITL